MNTTTFTQPQINNCPNLSWMGFEAGIAYDNATILAYLCLYLEPKGTIKNNGEHPPKPPVHG